ncbi:MAG: hypothetical protein AAB581_03635 [Patescibacteria group bacterium]
MEKFPEGEHQNVNNRDEERKEMGEQELPFEEQLALATALCEAVNNRNRFTDGYGGFDTFAEAWQHVGDNRQKYDELADAVSRTRQELDEKVSDKGAFVEQLKNAGHDDVANRIASMFSVSPKREGIVSRLRKKFRKE